MRNYLKIIGLFLVLLQSCATKKDVLYFQDAQLDTPKDVTFKEPTLQPNDILGVKITALNTLAAEPYNIQPLTGVNPTQNVEALKLQGYLVSKDYDITIPKLGVINVKGLTVDGLAQKMRKILIDTDELKDPSVHVRVLNSKVTVYGEVKLPGTFFYTEQTITLPQALGLAGDLTINGKRDDVLLIREMDGKRVFTHIDMTKTNWFDSPYYYIKQNDIIYVSPNTAKVKSSGIVGNAGTVLTAASVILSVVVLLTR